MNTRMTMLALSLALATTSTLASDDRDHATSCFSDFKPMIGDVGTATLPESAPYRLASPKVSQMTIVARDPSQASRFDSGNYDMHTANETGPDTGRYLFTVYETDRAGIQRTDLRTMLTTTIWASPAAAPALDSHVAFDASRWTPWGSFLTAEESWNDAGQPVSIYGRLFEVTNPLADPADIRMVHRDIIPRVSHEGLAFDKHKNLYFIDERNGSFIFKYVPADQHARNGDQYFAAGQTFVLRVGDGSVKEAAGQFTWVPLTTANGTPLPGTLVVTDANGVRGIDGRATPKLAEFLGTAFDRPEDLEIKTYGDSNRQVLFVATTTNHKVFAIDLARNTVSLYASRNTIDLATGLPVGNTFANPDNLAIDADGNIYIVEDQPGGVEDVWFTVDKDGDGVAEGVAKWASLSTKGAESTGLYFDRTRPDVAYINVQHPDSGVDRTIMLLAPRHCGKQARHHD
ncbi:MAG: DUF839 domain-containing protein [Burkholderiales bacterium]|nr:DUF839 domain-containing protein [Burkholderiales bacterium]